MAFKRKADCRVWKERIEAAIGGKGDLRKDYKIID